MAQTRTTTTQTHKDVMPRDALLAIAGFCGAIICMWLLGRGKSDATPDTTGEFHLRLRLAHAEIDELRASIKELRTATGGRQNDEKARLEATIQNLMLEVNRLNLVVVEERRQKDEMIADWQVHVGMIARNQGRPVYTRFSMN
jgi:hypothetical protein